MNLGLDRLICFSLLSWYDKQLKIIGIKFWEKVLLKILGTMDQNVLLSSYNPGLCYD